MGLFSECHENCMSGCSDGTALGCDACKEGYHMGPDGCEGKKQYKVKSYRRDSKTEYQ